MDDRTRLRGHEFFLRCDAMLENILEKKPARIAAVSIGGLLLILAIYSIYSFAAPGPAAVSSRQRMFICAESGKPFRHELSMGETLPVRSPFSGHNCGYPAELCYWTKEGAIRQEPVAVLLKQYIDEPGPTFCPDCGRLVIGHNPVPQAGAAPPPTLEQYTRSHRSANSDDAIVNGER